MISRDQLVTVTTTNEDPHGVLNVTVNTPRVLLFDVMVNVLVAPDAKIADVGETVRLSAADEVTVPAMLPSVNDTGAEPPFFPIDIDDGLIAGEHPSGVGLGLGVGVGVGVGVGEGVPALGDGDPFGLPWGVGVGVGVGVESVSPPSGGVGVGSCSSSGVGVG